MSLPLYKQLLLAAKKDPTPAALAALRAEVEVILAAGDHVRAHVLSRALVELGGQAVDVPESAALLAWKDSLKQAPVPPPSPPPPTARELWRAAQEAARRAADEAKAKAERPLVIAAQCRRLAAELEGESTDGQIYRALELVEGLEGTGSASEAAELLAWAKALPGPSAAATDELAAADARLAGVARPDVAKAKAAAEAALVEHEKQQSDVSKKQATEAAESLYTLGAVGAAKQLLGAVEAVVVLGVDVVANGGSNG